MTFILSFISKFAAKYFTTLAIEKSVIILLGALVERTNSKIDDELYNAVFDKTER